MSSNFKATIKLPQAVALYIGAVLGSGILIIPGLAAEIAGPASLMAWAGMMILVLPLALSMGFLSQKYPSAGGVSHFVTKAFGDRMGAVIGWFFLMSVPIGAPVASITGAGYFSSAFGLGQRWTIIIAVAMLMLALIINFIGMDIAGSIQVAVVISIILVLVLAVIGSIPNIELKNFSPFMPKGIASVGKASSILFWCFIGWEAVSHLSEEFVNPEKDVIRATIISAIIVGILYFMTALATVGTNSYGAGSQAALVTIIGRIFGPAGKVVIGTISLLICTATVIAYVGAASRLAFSLSKNGEAPKFFGYVSKKYNTPLGGLIFLGLSFILVVTLYSLKIVSLTSLIQLPNATFILTYLGGCAAGIVLLKDNKIKFTISLISLIATVVIFVFAGWAILYPLIISVAVIAGKLISRKKVLTQENTI
ncbi:amino acid permease [Clostridium sp. A1-XYC3]|uniref:Amino acid permease n=1 Tax=Clostridium tanneri TaxID=3037988 RepID=A0ABU4JW15_9CLOT|nr:amino acid permease [Clostridium sp. A1-XYC3]MDW8802339.1 amino acid permease [Clostridium sp. A1-XYC3]